MLLRIHVAQRHFWKAVEDREGGEGRIGCNLSSCEQVCWMGTFLFVAVGGLAPGGCRNGVPSPGREQPLSPQPWHHYSENIFEHRKNIESEKISNVVLNSVVILVWMKK